MSVDELAYDALCTLCEGETIPDELRPQARTILGDMLIARPEPCAEATLAAVDNVLAAEARAAPGLALTPTGLPDAQWLTFGSTLLAVWRGDACKLAAGAVVNAANEAGLGCFQPSHKCIDNVIHRAAGPRLREKCRQLMSQRGPLVAGSMPLVTAGYHLPSSHVLHVTGPMIQPRGRSPTAAEEAALAACYTRCLEACAAMQIRSIAFCCISTGLFGYPSQQACLLAVSTVCRWLLEDPKRQEGFDAIVFDVFTAEDAALYAALAPRIVSAILGDAPAFAPAAAPASDQTAGDAISSVASSDRLLIVAAAGLSISMDGSVSNPYHNAADFAKLYPTVAGYGYQTAYHAMGLAQDESVPAAVRVAFMARHFLNMREVFPPTAGYEMLRRLASTFAPRDVFAWTSNVDGCFERSGFDPDHVYTTQGEMNRLQCARAGCDTVWNCVEQMHAIAAASVDGALTDMALVPTCPRCGSRWPHVRPNLRGGDWFIHQPFTATSERLMAWLDECVQRRMSVTILEVGVGPNTPVVTRIPACAFASALQANSGRPTYLRFNPDPPEGPRENPDESVPFYRWRQSWAALEPLVDQAVRARSSGSSSSSAASASGERAGETAEQEPSQAEEVDAEAAMWQQRYRGLLLSLRTPR